MSALMALAETLLLEKLVLGGWGFSKKNGAGMALMAVSGLLCVVALGFLIVAFHAWVQAQYPPDIAALLTAGCVFAIAIVVALAAYSMFEYKKSRTEIIKNDLKSMLTSAVSLVDDELGDHVRENPTAALILASVAGFILADKIH